MTFTDQETFLDTIRQNLNRQQTSAVTDIPAPLPPRHPENLQSEIETFINEIRLLSGEAEIVTRNRLMDSITALVQRESVKKAVLWSTPDLQELGISEMLVQLNVEVIPNQANKHQLAECELGITGADFILPETGTLCLFAGPDKSMTTSLLPRIHLAILDPKRFRPDIHQVLEEAKGQGYLVFITGPSRTSDIELTMALGVHGPQKLIAWIMSEA